MDVDLLVKFLDQPQQSEDWLRFHRCTQSTRRPHGHSLGSSQSGLTLDLAALMCQQLEQILPTTGNADQAIANLERFCFLPAAIRSPWGTFWQRDPGGPADVTGDLRRQPALFKPPAGKPREPRPAADDRWRNRPPLHLLVDEFISEVAALTDDNDALAALGRLISRETLTNRLRGYRATPADGSCHGPDFRNWSVPLPRRSWQLPGGDWKQRRGSPRLADGTPAEFAILALGPIGWQRIELFQRY